ncbi:MAG: hypothetical protein FKY71_16285 [Spiribacter salinus]|uniref:Sulfotransferase n=1 Tax=Spiribacter salinus TaxID=1335746 RepID=A0A540VK00_9GAMM|nr:MAG: hypothetical protein FKY71_16285 [Spiribacter salinus]
MTLCFHIGLPKTATTLLQHTIFPELKGVKLVHRSQNNEAHELIRSIKRYVKRESPSAQKRTAIASILGELQRSAEINRQILMISDENISLSPDSFWKGGGANPQTVAQRLKEIADDAGIRREDTKILIGIRDQATWLASRYAQSSQYFNDFCQDHFTDTLNKIINDDRHQGAHEWLHFDTVHDSFCRNFDGRNVFFLPLEFFEQASHRQSGCLVASFLGPNVEVGDLSPTHERKRPNALSRSENEWRLKAPHDRIIFIPEQQKAEIAKRFKEPNSRFMKIKGEGLVECNLLHAAYRRLLLD